MSLILITNLFYKALISQGEFWYWSLIGYVQMDAITPNNVGTVHQPISLWKPCIMSVRRAQQCWKSCANGSNIVALRFGDHETKKCWDEKFDRFQTLRHSTQQHPTTCNRVCKRTQHEHPTMLRVVGQRCCVRLHAALGLKGLSDTVSSLQDGDL